MREVNIKKKRLKTGLEILLGSEENKELVKDKEAEKGILVLNINDISPNVDQPRSTFNEESIKELAKSIKAQGLLMPILVKVDNNKENKYKIIAGERRWRACKSIGLKDIKAFIYTNKSEKSEALAAIIENVQREDLSILEEARAYEKLIKNYKMTHENIANSLVDARPRDAHFTRDDKYLWVSSEIGGTVSIFDTATKQKVKTLSFAIKGVYRDKIQPVGIVLMKDKPYAFVALGPANRIAVINTDTFEVEDYILVGRRVWQLAFNQDQSLLLTTNGVSGDVSVINTHTLNVEHTVKVGRYPWRVAAKWK